MSKIDKRLDPQRQADMAVVDVARRIRYAGLVTMMADDRFVGAASVDGKPTVWYETDAATVARDYEFRTRVNPIKFDDIFRTRLPISIDQHMTQGVRITPEQKRFDEITFGRDILPPASKALANRLNAKIGDALLTTTDWKTTDLVLDRSDVDTGDGLMGQLLEIQLAMDEQGMPVEGRQLVAGRNVYKFIAASGLLREYDLTQANSVFRRGVRGRLDLVDMDLVNGVNLLDADDFYVLHPSWAVMPTSAGELPESGVAWSRLARIEEFAVRMQRGYSLDYDREGQTLHTYYKVNPINDEISRHTRETAAAANDGSVDGDPIITNDALVTTGKNVRIAKGTLQA